MSQLAGAVRERITASHHHPSEETLLGYAAGTLSAGPAVVTESHLSSCPPCRARLASLRATGGAVLEDLPPADMTPEAFSRTIASMELAGLDLAPALRGAVAQERPAPHPERPRHLEGVQLPATLQAYALGRWTWMAPGVKFCKIIVPGQPKANARIMRIAPNVRMPEHGHTGIEYTQVIHGAYFDGFHRYGVGDFSEADDDVEHQPVSDPLTGCVCVTAQEGALRFNGLLGRLLNPLGMF
ncbi:anti-sigma factor [Azorhizobium oxalatiphilum]|uniref:Anti-sigma factor n=1 Tax=Azorhizobium oxalatiphilum TaxID=980631 RepID=A0A917FC58_9HYPH|nr:ChrR family anti-sigma-E factor [Azorhizobium oxalatiphilum]GGF61167.1 anti-sigma factor [Azorhizobium oxalatiphilum]